MARSLGRLAAIPVTELKGVGTAKASSLEQVGIHTVLDLLTTYPRRYVDRTREARIADLVEGDEAMVVVRVTRSSSRRTRNRKVMVTADVTDGERTLRATFFNQPWRERQLSPGTQAILFGRFERYGGRPQMTNPVVDLIGDRTGRIIPVYPQSEKAGLMSWDLARWMDEVLERAGEFADPVPPAALDRFGLIGRTAAFRQIHAPESMAEVESARRRLVFDELLRVQLSLVERKQRLESESPGIAHAVDALPMLDRFVVDLPFPLTGAQQRVIEEIRADMGRPRPMHRLLQGDVGAGKTLVAVAMLLVAVEGGHQGALMAPTAVLAEQHAAGVRALLDGVEVDDPGTLLARRPLAVELLTNRTTAAERRKMLARLEAGEVDVLIGTHALIQEGVEFRSLGAVVIDEQHRFGVEQRAALRAANADGTVPDVLVMTATPIPRTAAMTVYGDLDVSVLDEMPPGRTPIRTEWVEVGAEGEVEGQETAAELAMWQHVRDEVADGRQAYVVCPLVEDSEKVEVASAEATYERLQGGELHGLRLGLLHGRVPPADKEQTMEAFRRGELDVLVATTVIEVGVDVPNATVMVVLDADRFGIAQLHQLRGRVGRGAARSHCYLVGSGATPDGRARLEALVRSTDGFELAEIDLDLRGEGTLMGERQKGRNDLKLASLRRDRDWVVKAREVAIDVISADPTLEHHQGLADELPLFLGDDESSEFLLKS
ncbi:ATP-dependent DNA helicase RecG [Actinomarinicola tropica]|uniref:ATP-dependent DNA helicase RecG n=1 Tax=Actinomarinicola tropica TaxID=2789776 RepID=A0A5Q2RGS6_9ACTN|nr:ATP-dependent DNA helicase RecG [Actinomarinicola tropica]QGG94834.1 ATP-dependent DNA helicase RecG [Actinomarinicola tropica]